MQPDDLDSAPLPRTLRSLSGPLVARMLSFWSSCAMSPQKRRNVRGRRTCGRHSMRTWRRTPRKHQSTAGRTPLASAQQ